MVDYFKTEINDPILIEEIRNNPLLVFTTETQKINSKTGELYYILNSKYRNLIFTVTADSNKKGRKLYISGSLHYYFNEGLHNANDFYYNDFIGSVNDLIQKFNIDPSECILRSLEYGINVTPLDQKAKKIIQNTFYHLRKKFNEPIDKPYKQSGNPRSNDFILKIYDKSYQFPEYTEGELLRFEIKYMRMRELKKIDISHLSDLLIKENHIKLSEILLQRFDEILLYDFTIRSNNLTQTERKNIANYSNPIYWENINLGTDNRRSFYYHKKRLKKIVDKHSDNIHNKLSQTINNKRFTLLNIAPFKGVEKEKVYDVCTTINSEKCMTYPHLYIRWKDSLNYSVPKENKEQKNKRKCRVTGVDISMQKEDSYLLSHTGLRYYYKEDKKLFNDIRGQYLSDKWEYADHETQIREIAHNIRNKIGNIRTRQNRLYPVGQGLLFELSI